MEKCQEGRAIVLAGGGARGAYQMGVWQALRELGLSFSIVTGTSVGALNGAFMVQDEYDFARSMWEGIDPSQVIEIPDFDKDWDMESPESLHFFLTEILQKGGANPKPLEDLLRAHLDEEKVRQSPVRFAFLTVEFPGFTPRIMDKSEMEPGTMVDYLMASSSCFPAMRMRTIRGRKFIDGGFYDNMPINLALKMGAKEIIAVDLDAVGARRKSRNPDDVPIRYIRSYWNLGNFLGFEAKTARRNMKLGYLDALKTLSGYQGQAYTFFPGELTKLVQTERERAGAILEPVWKRFRDSRSLLSEAGRLAILRCLANQRRKSPLQVSPLAMAAELCGQCLGVSPEMAYTAEGFREAVLILYRQLGSRDIHEEITDISQWVEEISKTLSPAYKTLYCLHRMQEYAAGTLEFLRLPALAAAMPTEFIAAFYLLSLL